MSSFFAQNLIVPFFCCKHWFDNQVFAHSVYCTIVYITVLYGTFQYRQDIFTLCKLHSVHCTVHNFFVAAREIDFHYFFHM